MGAIELRPLIERDGCLVMPNAPESGHGAIPDIDHLIELLGVQWVMAGTSDSLPDTPVAPSSGATAGRRSEFSPNLAVRRTLASTVLRSARTLSLSRL